jgi:methylmalonyl-CoA mutase
MSFPEVTAEAWRAQVDQELAGVPFEKGLVTRTAEGISVQPLYTEAPAGIGVEARGPVFRICVKVGAGAGREEIGAEIAGGAEALWVSRERALEGVELGKVGLVVDPDGSKPVAVLAWLASRLGGGGAAAGVGEGVALGADPFGDLARGRIVSSALEGAQGDLVAAVRFAEERLPGATAVTVSTLPYDDAGANGADEIGIALATGTAHLEALLDAGLTPGRAARQIGFRIAVGRDTFGELCKLRALRIGWRKVLAASGASDAPRTRIHAVSSSRSLTARDPWVNMLRVTTEVFAAAIGGADLVTAAAFDAALGPPSAMGRRIARNTGLVLRDESALGKVRDPAGGSYYFDTLTDALAREGWKRFQAIEREGGMADALASGRLRARLEGAWRERLDLIAKRKVAVLGVSEFANLDEKLPRAPGGDVVAATEAGMGLAVHRDAEPFEALRLRADASATRPEAILVTLGPLAESRPRVGFASSFFGAGGIRVRETTGDETAVLACLCGSDERYAAEAVPRAGALKAAGCRRVLLAGRPGNLEAALREAGVDGFLFVGCDVVALLSELLDAFR